MSDVVMWAALAFSAGCVLTGIATVAIIRARRLVLVHESWHRPRVVVSSADYPELRGCISVLKETP